MVRMGEIPCCIDLSDYNYNANALISQAKLIKFGILRASAAVVISFKKVLTGICLRIRLLLYSIHKTREKRVWRKFEFTGSLLK